MEFNKEPTCPIDINNNNINNDIEAVYTNVENDIINEINNEHMRENNINYNKKLILNIIIGISFTLSISYIIYLHNELIYNNFKQIKKITEIF